MPSWDDKVEVENYDQDYYEDQLTRLLRRWIEIIKLCTYLFLLLVTSSLENQNKALLLTVNLMLCLLWILNQDIYHTKSVTSGNLPLLE